MVHDKESEEARLLIHDVEDQRFLGSNTSDSEHIRTETSRRPPRRSFSKFPWLRKRRLTRSRSPLVVGLRRTLWPQSRRKWPVRLLIVFTHAVVSILTAVLFCSLLFPSYTNPPQRYTVLRKEAFNSEAPGRANPRNERVFIAASLRDKRGGLVSGEWGRNILSLIDLLGPDNVFLSIYENDPDEKSIQALGAFESIVPSDSAIVHEHLDKSQFDRVIDLNGSQQLKRIAVLAEVRNRALLPLEDPSSKAYSTQWDKLLYLNDIVVDPIDAANLLFNTNVNARTGLTDYRAACAMDFINPFKFYDTYATRDLEGYSIGVPVYPWFTGAGRGESRRDVLDQTDAVRVKSCWGGMVAFEAKWFQPYLYRSDDRETLDAASKRLGEFDSKHLASVDDRLNASFPLRFRSEPDNYWDASECCLIHADLSYRTNSPDGNSGIYMNPYIRVAYTTSVLELLPLTRRFERLYSPFQNIINRFAGLPRYNPRRLEHPGDEHVERVWQWDDDFVVAAEKGMTEALGKGPHGRYVNIPRVATPGQFCGIRKLSVIMDVNKTGKRYGAAKVPPDH